MFIKRLGVQLFFLLSLWAGADCVGALPVHHLFPQEAAMRPYFELHGIDPHAWCVALPTDVHRRLHKNPFNWNKKWAGFISVHPISTRKELFGFAWFLVAEAGIEEYAKNIVDNYGKENGNKFPPDNISKVMTSKLSGLFRTPTANAVLKKLGTPEATAAFYLAAEIYMAFAALDDDFQNNPYIDKAITYFTSAVGDNEAGDSINARHNMGRAYYFLGYACFSKAVEYRSEFSKEIADKFSNQSQRYLGMAEHYLSRATVLDESNPYARFHLGVTQKELGAGENARENIQKAMDLFTRAGNKEFIEACQKELEVQSK